MLKSRTGRSVALTLFLCVLLCVAFAVPAMAASYSKVYGTTKDRIRVRDAASSSATTIDNIVKDRCVYILQSKESSGITWIQVNYIGHEGSKLTGWVAQTDGRDTFVRVLSTTQAKSTYGVSDGKLPSKVAGAWTAKEREAAKASSTSSASADTIKEVQTRLKSLGLYSGEITGNVGAKTTAAIKEFQRRNGLTADGVAGPETISKLRAKSAGSSTSSSSSSSVSTDVIKDVQAKLKNMGIYSGEVTGNIGAKTTAAIKEFQKRYGLTQDGVPGTATVAKLNSVYSGSSTKTSTATTSTGLGLGSSGSGVRELQQNLTALGYYWADITGNFGAKTETAVKAFQKAYGLTQDGVAGTTTLNAIANAMAKKGVSASTGKTTTMSTSGTLQLNSEGAQVTALQTNLKALGFYSGDITGHYGEKTRDAVKAFQNKNNLTADGVAGSATLRAIANAASRSTSTASSSTTSTTTLTIDSSGSAVRALQTNLATLGYYKGDITGHYGSKTAEAVRAFQKAKGYAQTGTASPTIQNAIAVATGKSDGTASSGLGSVSLREGDSGTQVTALQTALNKIGYYYGEITGHYGSLTTKAVRRFQDDNDLTVDGVAGPKTVALINSKAGSSVQPSANTGNTSSTSTGTTKTSITSYARLTRDNVVLRKTASATAAGVKTLKVGTQMKISERVTVNGEVWYKVTTEQVDGYKYTGYVRASMTSIISSADYNASSSSSSSDDEIDGMIRVSSDNIAIREGPGTDYDVVGRANYGDTYFYIGVSGGWYHLLNGYYISSNYAYRVSDSDASSYYAESGSTSYRYGDTDPMVSWIQTALTTLGYYSGSITGTFGGQTEDAVKAFQDAHSLTADGIAGKKTIAAIQSAISGSGSSSVSYQNTVYDMNWFKAKAASGFFSSLGFVAKNNNCYLIDIATGKRINIHIQSAGNHLDAEPLTAADTSTFCSLWGVSSASNINYLRRPMIIVTQDATYKQIICSVYGTPHGTQDITNNNYPGQFCIHFLNSTTSGTKVVSSYAVAALQKAREAVKAAGKNLVTLYP